MLQPFFVRRSWILGLSLIVATLLQSGCSTQKNSFVNRTYHQLNAKYNGYFNARESFSEGVRRLAGVHTDNFEEVLSVFSYGTAQDAVSVSAYMDVAYEKASLVIRRHSMNIRGEEYNQWIDESFFLIGRSHFFKRDFNLAILTFEYIIRSYDTPRSFEAKVWIAKCYHEQERYEQAQRMLEMAMEDHQDGLMTNEGSALLLKTYADHHLRQENHGRAAEYLDKAIPYIDSKSDRVRMTFILAQLYHRAGNFSLAQQTFGRVLDLKPGFDMAFQARIGMAVAFDPAVGGGGNIRSQLMQMLDNSRNDPFRDQIYYALAQLSVRQGDEAGAIEMYQRAASFEGGNDMQKGLAFLRLGEIYFGHPDYLEASMYYDSAQTYLPRSYSDYQMVQSRQSVLSGLARQAAIIAREDSLQRLARMPGDQQRAVAQSIIDAIRDEERLALEQETETARAMQDAARLARQAGRIDTQDRGWYFYNANAIEQGKNEFFGRFGERPLADMWRLSAKQDAMAGGFGMDEFMEEREEAMDEVADRYDIDAYLRNIPNSQEALRASEERMANAHYQMAMIFRDHLGDPFQALERLEFIVNDFPGSPREPYAYYYLVLMNRQMGRFQEAAAMLERLLRAHPDSEFSRILGDPMYAERIRERESLGQRMYQESYMAFSSGRYDVVERHMQALDTMQVDRDLRARFNYLYALSRSRVGDSEAFAGALRNVVNDYEGSPVHQPAAILLASLESAPRESLAANGDADAAATHPDSTREGNPPETVFQYGADQRHFVVVLVNSSLVNPTTLVGVLEAFHSEEYETSDLSVSNVYFEENRQLITVASFQDKDAATAYFGALPNEVTPESLEGVLHFFIISVDNYPLFFQNQLVEEYVLFHDFYYLD